MLDGSTSTFKIEINGSPLLVASSFAVSFASFFASFGFLGCLLFGAVFAGTSVFFPENRFLSLLKIFYFLI
jgi:hypothetical protein